MITAVDSSVLLDIFTDDAQFRRTSLAALRSARARGALVACAVVWAEVAARFDSAETLHRAMAAAEVGFDAMDGAAAELAGTLWRRYRRADGKREHMVPDFLLGAHAQLRCGRLLSRDAGFYRRYFERLQLVP